MKKILDFLKRILYCFLISASLFTFFVLILGFATEPNAKDLLAWWLLFYFPGLYIIVLITGELLRFSKVLLIILLDFRILMVALALELTTVILATKGYNDDLISFLHLLGIYLIIMSIYLKCIEGNFKK